MKKVIRRGALAVMAVLLLLPGCAPGVPVPSVYGSAPLSPAPVSSRAAGDPGRYYVVEKNGLKGVINGLGQTIVPYEFTEAWVCGDEGEINGIGKGAFGPSGGYVCGEGTPAFIFAGTPTEIADAYYYEAYIYGLDGRLLYDKKCNEADPLGGRLIKYIGIDGICGVITCEGGVIIPGGPYYVETCGEYIITAPYGEGPAETCVYGRDGVLVRSGKIDYNGVSGSLIEVKAADGKCGLVDTEFKEVVPAEYSWIWYKGGGLYIVERGDKYGVLSEQGIEVIPVSYDDVEVCDGGSPEAPLFSAFDGSGAYVFDSSGKQLAYIKDFVSVSYFGEVVIAKDRGGLDHCFTGGKEIISQSEMLVWDEEAQMVMSMYAGTCACFTKDGERLPFPQADYIVYISADRFMFNTGLLGICGRDGAIIVPAQYNSLGEFGDRGLRVYSRTSKGKTTAGVIDSQNGKVILEGYEALADAGGGLLYAVSGEYTGLIDIDGNWVWRSDFED